jgi:serine/threonine-protein kinase
MRDRDISDKVPTQVGPYQIIEKIGEGGIGVVYKARHPQQNRTVAVKVINHANVSERERKRLRQEAQSVAQLRHPNIVCVQDMGSDDGVDYLVMEWIVGKSLGRIAEEGHLAIRKLLELIREIALLVDYAHRQGFIHHHLKPANIIVEQESGRPLILDFGLAKELSGGKIGMGTELASTLRYMSPEMLSQPNRKISPHVDVYGLGLVLYEILSGGIPAVKGSCPMQAIHNVIQHKIVPLHELNPKINKDFDLICSKALEKKPRLRYASAQALAKDIERVLNGEPIMARRQGVWHRLWELIG